MQQQHCGIELTREELKNYGELFSSHNQNCTSREQIILGIDVWLRRLACVMKTSPMQSDGKKNALTPDVTYQVWMNLQAAVLTRIH